MTVTPELWRATLTAAKDHAFPLSEALEFHCDSVSMFEHEDHADLMVLHGYCEDKPSEEGLKSALKIMADNLNIACPEVEISLIPATNWLEESYQSFPPIDAGCFYIYGSHIDQETLPEGKRTIQINAATAFGSGEHGTTYGCLKAIDHYARPLRRKQSKILDMGCGTGILGIAAAKLLKQPVLLIDNDPEAVKVSNENIALNQVKRYAHAFEGDGYKAPQVSEEGPFDLIIANILAKPLMDMAPDMAENLALNGKAILSGLLVSQVKSVRRAQEAAGLKFVKKFTHGDWATLVFEKKL